MTVSFAISKKGKDHLENQDRYFASDDLQLYAVADGVSIPAGGGMAAELAIDALKKYFCEDIEETFLKINEHILNKRKKFLVGYTTLTVAHVKGNELIVASVGDSPCFLVNDNIQLVNQLDESFDGYLLQAIGQDKINPHVVRKKIEKNSYIILSTDGISDVVSEEKIFEVVKEEKEVEKIARKIVAIAESSFQIYNDDKTIIVTKYE